MLACSQDHFTILQVDVRKYSITTIIRQLSDNKTWSITGVYGPHGDAEKAEFMQELKQIKLSTNAKWIILGDFNLYHKAYDKSSGRLNHRNMSRFRCTLDELEMRELHLHGHRFTRTSGTANPVQTKIDHIYTTQEWELAHPHCHLQALSSSTETINHPSNLDSKNTRKQTK
jgi:exonuclease III